MRKIAILFISLIFILTACGQSEPSNVEITLPASIFEGENIDEVIVKAKSDGIDEVTKNEDGSLTYKMSKAKHNEMMEEIKDSFIQSIEEIKTSGDYPSIKNIEYNNDFSEFTMIVEKSAYENSFFDNFAVFGLGMEGLYYQMYNGVDPEQNKVKINIKDDSTGEIFDTIIYPDEFQ